MALPGAPLVLPQLTPRSGRRLTPPSVVGAAPVHLPAVTPRSGATVTGGVDVSNDPLFQVVPQHHQIDEDDSRQPGTPLSMHSMSSQGPTGTSTPNPRPVQPAGRPGSGAHDETEVPSRKVRAEIEALGRELRYLEELDERERQAELMREKARLEDRIRREKEVQERRMKEETEMRKFQEQQRAERQARMRAEEQKRIKERETQEEERQRLLWEHSNANGRPAEDAQRERHQQNELQRFQDVKARKEAMTTVKRTIRDDLKKMYDELEGLQDTDTIRQRQLMDRKAASNKVQALRAEVNDNFQLEEEWNKMKTQQVKAEITSMKDELSALERADRLATKRQEAIDAHEREMRATESERQVAYMESCRARARASVEPPVEAVAPPQQQPLAGRPVTPPKAPLGWPPTALRTVVPAVRAGSDEMSVPIDTDTPVEMEVQPTPPHTQAMDPMPVTRHWLSQDEAKRIEMQDVEAQREKQRRDLARLQKEQHSLMDDQIESERQQVHTELRALIVEEQDVLLSRMKSKAEPTHPGGAPLPVVELYRPQYLKSRAPVKGHDLLSMQQEQELALQAIEEKYQSEKARAAKMFQEEEVAKNNTRKYRIMKESEREMVAAQRDKEKHQQYQEEQHYNLSRLRNRLEQLENEEHKSRDEQLIAQAQKDAEHEKQRQQEQYLKEAQEKAQEEELEEKRTAQREDDYQRALGRMQDAHEKKIKEAQEARRQEAERWAKTWVPPDEPEEQVEVEAARPSMDEDEAANAIQGLYKIREAKKESHRRKGTRQAHLGSQFQHDAAAVIQTAYRSKLARSEAQVAREEAAAAFDQQRRAEAEEESRWNPDTDVASDDPTPVPIMPAAPEPIDVAPVKSSAPPAEHGIQTEQVEDTTQQKIAELEEKIKLLQTSLLRERRTTQQQEMKESEMHQLRSQKDRQQRQIENLNELLLSHANIIKQLEDQVVSMAPQPTPPAAAVEASNNTAQSVQTESVPDDGDRGAREDESARAIQAAWRAREDKKYLDELRQEEDDKVRVQLENEAAEILQGFLRQGLAKKEAHQRRAQRSPRNGSPILSPVEDDDERHESAVKIQQAYRRHATDVQEAKPTIREQYHHVILDESALLIQTHWRAHQARKATNVRREERAQHLMIHGDEEAAIRIQAAWRQAEAKREVARRRHS